MSKRAAGDNFGSGEERYGGPGPGMDANDKPVQATAAQMARRKIAAAKKTGARARSGSPVVPAPTSEVFGMFGGGASQQSKNMDFSFSGAQTSGTSSSQPYRFGAPSPAPTQPQQKGTSNIFGQSAATPSFGTSFGSNGSQPPQNGSNPSTSMFNQQSQQSTTTGFTFGQTQSVHKNGTLTPATSFGVFGSQPSQNNTMNGNTSFNSGAAAQVKQEPNTTNAFASFGQAPAAKPDQTANPFANPNPGAVQSSDRSSNSFGGFHNTQSTQPHGSMPGTPLFPAQDKPRENGQTNSSASLFAGLGQQKSQELAQPVALFPGLAGNKDKSPEKVNTPFSHSAQKPAQSTNQPLFGISQPVQQTPKPATNLFSGLSNTQPPKLSGSVFGAPATTQPPRIGSGLFGAQPMPSDAGKGKSTGSILDNLAPRETPQFGSHIPGQVVQGDEDHGEQPDASGKTELFPRAKSPEKAAEKQLPSSNLFGGLGNSQVSQSNSLFQASSALQDTSMTTPTATPQQPPLFAPTETPATQPPRSLFDRISAPAPSITPATAPAKSLFARLGQASNDTPEASQLNHTAETPSAAKPLFQQATTTPAAAASLFQKALSPPSTPATAPARSLFARLGQNSNDTTTASQLNHTAETPSVAKPLFQPATTSPAAAASPSQKPAESQRPAQNLVSQTTPAAAPAAPAATCEAPPATAPIPRTLASPDNSAISQVSDAAPEPSASQEASFRKLNDALIAHLGDRNTSKDWSELFRFALIASAEIAGREPPSETELRPTPPRPSASSRAVSSGATSSSAVAPPASSSTGSDSQNESSTAAAHAQDNRLSFQTPKTATSSSLARQPPATAPNKKRLLEENNSDTARQPATEKRSKPNHGPKYPDLPSSASATAKLFAATLEKIAQTPTPSSPSGEFTSAARPASSVTPAAETAQAAATLGATPAARPSASGFTPAAKPSSSGFTPAAQPAPRGFTPAVSAGGFTPANGTGGSNFLSSFGAAAKAQEEKDRKKRKAEDYDSDEETEEQWLQRDQEAQAAKRKKIEDQSKGATGFRFGASTSSDKQPTAAGLETETPITFQPTATAPSPSATPAAAPPKSGFLFGAASTLNPADTPGKSLFGPWPTTSTDTSGKLAPPSTGFNFGSQPSSLGESRATTPGVTIHGEASNAAGGGNGDDDAQKDTQAKDQTGLKAEEREANEVLAEIRAKTAKYESDGKGNTKFVAKGLGTLYLLKDKTDGKTRIVSRIGTGKLILNYHPLKEGKYEVHPKKDTIVAASFYDHIHASPAAVGNFMFTTKSADDAKELARILTEGRPQ